MSDPQIRQALKTRKVALVHDWLLGMRGGEWVLHALTRLFPQATIYTLFCDPAALDPQISALPIVPGVLNQLPAVARYYRWLLPALPWAAEQIKIPQGVDLVLSTSHCVVHGVRRPAGAIHVNYCFSPMRYLYDQASAYQRGGGLAAQALELAAPRLRTWDHAAARRADHLWTLSDFVARRIQRVWELEPQVIYPPVRTEFFVPPQGGERNDEYLLVSAMVPYKRVDLAIRAANRAGFRLRVAGDGPLLDEMRQLAGPTVTVEGRVSDQRLRELYQTCRALIFTAEEDFGIIPLEAMACGMPVLGLGRGGLRETLPEGTCGQFFAVQDVDCLLEAWGAFRPADYDPAALRTQAGRFGVEQFLDQVAGRLGPILGLD